MPKAKLRESDEDYQRSLAEQTARQRIDWRSFVARIDSGPDTGTEVTIEVPIS